MQVWIANFDPETVKQLEGVRLSLQLRLALSDLHPF